jgi:hypothetical protein
MDKEWKTEIELKKSTAEEKGEEGEEEEERFLL